MDGDLAGTALELLEDVGAGADGQREGVEHGGIVVLAWVYARRSRRWVWPLLALPALVLLARLYQGAHHLTDVLTSIVYASVWLLVLARLLLTARTSASGRTPRHSASPSAR